MEDCLSSNLLDKANCMQAMWKISLRFGLSNMEHSGVYEICWRSGLLWKFVYVFVFVIVFRFVFLFVCNIVEVRPRSHNRHQQHDIVGLLQFGLFRTKDCNCMQYTWGQQLLLTSILPTPVIALFGVAKYCSIVILQGNKCSKCATILYTDTVGHIGLFGSCEKSGLRPKN